LPPAEEPVLGRRVDQLAEPARLGTLVPQPAEMVRSSVQLKRMASSGGFAVDETTGNRMIETLEAALDSLETRWAELEKLQQNPPMSDSPAARWVAKHMVDTATDQDGLLTQLVAARREIPTYIEAIQLAKRSYEEQDTAVCQTMKVIRDDLGEE
jgi:hypothetical protein